MRRSHFLSLGSGQYGRPKIRQGSANLALVMPGVHAAFALFELRVRSVWEAESVIGVTNSDSGDALGPCSVRTF